MGTKLVGDHLSMGTKFDGDCLSRGIKLVGDHLSMGTKFFVAICPWGQEMADWKSGDQMGSGPNESRPILKIQWFPLSILIFGRKSCFLGPIIFKIPQPI